MMEILSLGMMDAGLRAWYRLPKPQLPIGSQDNVACASVKHKGVGGTVSLTLPPRTWCPGLGELLVMLPGRSSCLRAAAPDPMASPPWGAAGMGQRAPGTASTRAGASLQVWLWGFAANR